MDYQKDNRFRSQGNETNSQGHEQKNKQQSGVSFIVRKAEKLTTALYMVTDIMSDKEPMKWKARENAVELLSDITVSLGEDSSARMSALRDVAKKIERVISFLGIAQSTRMISEMNSSVLKREYAALKDAIEAEWKRVYEGSKSIFNESFFEVEHAPERTLPSGQNEGSTPREDKGQTTHTERATPAIVQGQEVVSETKKEPSKPFTQNNVAPRINFNTNQSGNSDLRTALRALAPEHRVASAPGAKEETPRVTPLPPITPRVASEHIAPPQVSRATVTENGIIERARPDVGRDDRRKIILALIKQKPSLTVKDIAKSIPGVSEKTIQRELLAMVSENILMKRGERRWSTYSLIA